MPMHIAPEREVIRRRFRFFRFRVLALVGVFAMALAAFALGVGVSDRPYVPEAGWPVRIYYALGLFVLGGLDMGTPTGGPPWARAMLWAVYFLAPAITTTALVEGVVRAFGRQRGRLQRLRHHFVIVGCGRLALLVLQSIRERDPRQKLVVVEKNRDKATAKVAADRHRAEMVWGDIDTEAVLQSLRLDRARGVILLTNDDLANLDAAARILEKAPNLAGHVRAHVGSIHMLRTLERTDDLLPGCRVFNGHQTAARHLVHQHLLPRFAATEKTDIVALAGFGRFGQTVLAELQKDAGGSFDTVVLVDLEARRRQRVFAGQVGFANYQLEVVEGDIQDPGTWKEARRTLEQAEHELVIVLGSHDASINIWAALALAKTFPKAHLVVRCFYPTAFTERLAQQAGFSMVYPGELLLESLKREGLVLQG